MRIIDEHWTDVPIGSPGEVAVAGAGVTPGYLGNEGANATSSGGLVRTGDQGVVRDGYLYLQGRLKEMIIRGGENVSCPPRSTRCCSPPCRRRRPSASASTTRSTEQIEAAVVLSETVTEQELQAHCRRSLAAFKIPRKILVVDAIPTTPTGKVQRRLVAAEFAGDV